MGSRNISLHGRPTPQGAFSCPGGNSPPGRPPLSSRILPSLPLVILRRFRRNRRWKLPLLRRYVLSIEEIATPVCGLARNDSRNRQPVATNQQYVKFKFIQMNDISHTREINLRHRHRKLQSMGDCGIIPPRKRGFPMTKILFICHGSIGTQTGFS